MSFKPTVLSIAAGGTNASTRLGALTSLGAVGVLGSVSVDLTVAATTGIFTVPGGQNAIITEVYAIITDANTVTVAPTITLGLTPTFDEWLGAFQLTGLNAVNMYAIFPPAAESFFSYPAGSVFSVDVSGAATATALDATFYVVGFLV